MRTATKQEAINGNSNDTVITPLRLKQVLSNVDINPGEGGGGSSDTPVYTAGDGISIINNVISNTINKTSQLINDSNFITEADLPDININDPVPINSIFAYEGDTVPDGFIEYTGEIGGGEVANAEKNEMITIKLPEDYYYETPSSWERYALPLNEVLSQIGDNLSLTPEGRIKIGKGISKISVNASALVYRTNSVGVSDIGVRIFRNGSAIFMSMAYKYLAVVKTFETINLILPLVDVQENDELELSFTTAKTDKFRYSSSSTYLSVKKVLDNNIIAGDGENIDLTDYAKKNEIPKNLSQLNNDSGFINSIPEDVLRKDTDVRVSNVVSRNLYNKDNIYRTGFSNQNVVNDISLKPNTSYYFKTGKTWTEIKLYDSEGVLTRSLGGNDNTTEIQFNTSSNEIKGQFIFYVGNYVELKDFTGIQLEEGIVPSDYVPYLNLQETILNYTELKDTELRLSNVVSRNLFNAWNYNYENDVNGCSHIINNTNKITFNIDDDWARKKVIFKLKPNTTYTISSDITNNNGYYCGFWKGSDNPLSTDTSFNSKLTFTTDDNGEFGVWFYCNFSVTTTTGQVVFDNIQLEENAIATDYVPYLNLEEVMNKHRVYSTSEQVIGTSVDGKPLYAITLLGTTIAGDLQIDLSYLNIEKIRDISGATGANGDFKPINFYFSNYSISTRYAHGMFYIFASDVYAGNPFEVTIEYTKTTD